MSFRNYYLCPSFTQQMHSTSVDIIALWGDLLIALFFDIFKGFRLLWWKIILNGSKQTIIRSGEYGGWGKISRFISYIYFLRFLLYVDEYCHERKLVCHKVWRTLAAFFQCLIYCHEFFFIANSCDRFTRFQQLVVYHTFSPNTRTEHHLLSMNIVF